VKVFGKQGWWLTDIASGWSLVPANTRGFVIFIEILQHFLVNVLYRTTPDSIFEDDKSVLVKLLDAFLDILAAELRCTALRFGHADSTDFKL